MDFETGIEDPLGFTKEVANLLSGLSCTNLSEFKKRNIAYDDLMYLTDDDFKILGNKFLFISCQ